MVTLPSTDSTPPFGSFWKASVPYFRHKTIRKGHALGQKERRYTLSNLQLYSEKMAEKDVELGRIQTDKRSSTWAETLVCHIVNPKAEGN
jgi:hypothetical protein